MVQVCRRCEGWEGMTSRVEPAVFALERGESRDIAMDVIVPGDLPAGAHERAEFLLTAKGDGAARASRSLVTMSRLSHPFLYHDRAGRRGRELAQFRQSYDTCLRDADAYAVEPMEPDKPYCCPTQVEHPLMSCAYAYGMTGDRACAEKIPAFFRRFTGGIPDPRVGLQPEPCAGGALLPAPGHLLQHDPRRGCAVP